MKPSAISLRKRLLWAIIAPLSVVMALSVAFGHWLTQETADAAFDQRMTDFILEISSHIQKDEADLAAELSSEVEVMLRNEASDRIYFAVRNQTGTLLAGAKDIDIFAARTSPHPLFMNSQFRGKPIRVATQRIAAPRGEVAITVVETVVNRSRASSRILTAMILPNLVIVLATLLAVYFGVRRGLVPLNKVEKDIASRSPFDLKEIEVATTPVEIQPMLVRLNDLFGLLREASAAQQRFLADAAHQLRTPLAGLQTQIELAANEGRFEQDAERLLRIEEATTRMSHLVNQLLTYARTEPAAAISHSLQPVGLHNLVEQAASIFLDQALSRGIDIGFEARPAHVMGIPWMLRECLANLIDNALRYTPPGGVVTVSCDTVGAFCVLSVEDNGPGIPSAEREQVFERFYRVQGSSSNGCGLGLAIVREIARLHAADIRLEEPEHGGLRFILAFPHQKP